MGMLDRMMDRGSLLTPQTESQSSTPAQDDPPVVRRMQVTADYLLRSISRNGETGNKAAFLMKKVMLDSFKDLGEVPPDITEFYMRQAASVLYWAATGEVVTDTPLPDDFPAVDWQGNPMVTNEAHVLPELPSGPDDQALQVEDVHVEDV